MKKLISVALLCTLPLAPAFADEDIEANVAESKEVIKEFFGELKGELVKAMKEGGPINAIKICKITAPAIAHAKSEKYGMKVGRTSLKLRNPKNAPDAWEAKVLQKFEERQAAGEDPAKMVYYEVVEENGQKSFRFMKAIGMPPLEKMPCLKCHGTNIDPKVAAKLDELYPEDKARGYKAGQIRGAFTITKPM